MAFNLITAPGGVVTHYLDAAFRASLTGDCIIHGCNFGFSGNVVSMSEGVMMIKGREIENTAKATWDMPANVEAAYIVVHIRDDVLSISVETAPSPVTNDINDTMTTTKNYDRVLCNVQFSNGSISAVGSAIPTYTGTRVIVGLAKPSELTIPMNVGDVYIYYGSDEGAK